MKPSLLMLCLCLSLPPAAAHAAGSDASGLIGAAAPAAGQAPSADQALSGAITGTVLGHPFAADQAIFKDGVLTLRQGDEFFPDLAVLLFSPVETPAAGQVLQLNDSTPGHVSIQLKHKPAGQNLPNTEIIQSGYQVALSFGEPQTLGVPLTVSLTVTGPHSAQVAGTMFATSGDLKMTPAGVDLTFDSFDTLRLVATSYLKREHGIEASQLADEFGLSYRGDGDRVFPKTGFIGYEIQKPGEPLTLAKLQLQKDAGGWAVARQLAPDQISPAHPLDVTVSSHDRTQASDQAAAVTGRHLEAQLVAAGVMPQVRATSIDCYPNQAQTAASCRAVYGVKKGDETECQTASFVLRNSGQAWQMVGPIKDTERMDYKTDQVVPYRPLSTHCE